MDPDENLKQQKALAKRMLAPGAAIDSDDAEQLATLVLALDGWIKRGGFLPTAWKRG